MPPSPSNCICSISPLYIYFIGCYVPLCLPRPWQLSRCMLCFPISPLSSTADCCLLSITFHPVRPLQHPDWLLYGLCDVTFCATPAYILLFWGDKPACHIILALVLGLSSDCDCHDCYTATPTPPLAADTFIIRDGVGGDWVTVWRLPLPAVIRVV